MIGLTTCKIVHRIALVAMVAVFFGLVFEQGDASAEQCKDNERSYSGKNSKALTKIVNNSNGNITVTIVRRISTKKDGSYEQGGSSWTDETEVDAATVDSGENLEYKLNVSLYQENRVQIKFNSLGTDGTYCEYKVRTGDNNTNWSRVKDQNGNLVDCYGTKALDVCENCGISCSRSYDKGKDEWKTTFTVTSYN